MTLTRDMLAALFRTLPRVRGKGRIGVQLTRLLTNAAADEDCIVTFRMRDGSRMRVDVRSRAEIGAFWTGEYDRDLIERLASALTPGCIVLDVGANVGFYAVSLGRKTKALGGKLYAFEPIRSNFDRLVEVTALNGLDDTVHPINVALGDEEGRIRLYREDSGNASTGNAICIKDGAGGNLPASNAEAVITRLDTLARERGIASCRLIKVDVEGAELMFLRGAAGFVRRHRPIIYGEFHAWCMRQFGHTFADVAALTAPWGYRFYRQEGRSAFVAVAQPGPGLENVLLTPDDLPAETLARLGVLNPQGRRSKKGIR